MNADNGYQDYILSKRDILPIVSLILLSLVVIFFALDSTTIWNTDEARYARVSKEMLESGNLIQPQLWGKPYYNKPPLMDWLIILSTFLFGGFSEFSVRFPSAVFGTACVMVTYLLGKIFFNRLLAFFGAVILLTTFGFNTPARFCKADMVMVFFMTLSLYTFALWYFKKGASKEHFSPWLFYVPLGLAVLAKGPQAIVLCPLVIFIFLLLMRDLSSIKNMRPLLSILILSIVILPWYVAGFIVSGQEFVNEIGNYFKRENFDMFAGEKPIHYQPWYYYFGQFSVQQIPWLLFLPSALFAMFYLKAKENRRRFIFLLVWFLSIFIFFSIAGAKRHYYLLPLYPSVSLLVALFFECFPLDRKTVLSRLFMALPFLLILIPSLFYIMFPDIINSRLTKSVRPYTELIFTVAIILAILSTGLLSLTLIGRIKTSFVIVVTIMVILHIVYAGYYEQRLTDKEGPDGIRFCRKVAEIIKGETVYFYKFDKTYFAYYIDKTTPLISRDDILNNIYAGKKMFIMLPEGRYNNDNILKDNFNVLLDEKPYTGGSILLIKSRYD
ncbi:MAG: hypothetical protein A2W23_04370 [Planctomycetes bacterium RBG_16_43_13]|nr:MAG: hypothetical protein A2W23_04370 [Planctomycetes bacterium RBG_16_43_13]